MSVTNGSVIINGTLFVYGLNGTLINENDCTAATCSLNWAELSYIPTYGGNLAYFIIFAAFLLAHLVMGPLYRTWGFFIGMTCGLLLEIIGYAGRLMLHHNIFSFTDFVIYLVCLTVGPAYLSAAIYVCLSRLVVVYGEHIARFSPKTYTITFIGCDTISLVLQAAGGAVAASSNAGSSGQQAGVNIMIAGLAFQVFSLFIFMVLGMDFAVAVLGTHQGQLNMRYSHLRRQTSFRFFPYAIAIATLFIFIRCCYRVAELQGGFSGSLANNETIFMILEGPMIMIAVLSLTLFHPGRCFGGAAGWKSANWTWRRGSQQQDHYPKDFMEPKPTTI